MTEKQIVERLERCGFQVQKDKNDPDQDARGWSNYKGDLPLRLEHPSAGGGSSLYVAPDFVSATGKFRRLADDVPPTDYNRKDTENPNPHWERAELARLLDLIAERYS